LLTECLRIVRVLQLVGGGAVVASEFFKAHLANGQTRGNN
jgi:hypothetical protein